MHGKAGPECNGCKNFYVSWDAAFPYGCKGFQMKTKRSPSLAVLQASGTKCMLFQRKKRSPDRRPGDRRI
jgi:hypothetical protein